MSKKDQSGISSTLVNYDNPMTGQWRCYPSFMCLLLFVYYDNMPLWYGILPAIPSSIKQDGEVLD